MKSISVTELQQRIDRGEEIQLIDVREPWEHELFNIGGTLLPMGSVLENNAEVARDKPVVLYCQKGIRSQIVIQRLQQKYDYTNLLNLTGGMDAWQKAMLSSKG